MCLSSIDLFKELLLQKDIKEISSKINLNINTIRRWVKDNKVPENYYNDLNSLLNNKYPIKESFKQQDKFYTLPRVAEFCFNKAKCIISSLGYDLNEYTFIEPSVGNCDFYNLMPINKRIGIDISPNKEIKDIITKNFLEYTPAEGKYITCGNPPFGLRGNLALRFINHASLFSDFVCFILPPLFDSTGKGVPMKRVKGLKLIHTEKLPLNSFYYPDGTETQIATIFQIWSKYGNVNLVDSKCKDYSDIIKIYSLSNGKTSSQKRNVKMINKCDVYLPSTCFNGMKAYLSFDDLPNKRGYGLVIKKNKDNIIKQILNIDWNKVAFLSTNSALNLRTDLILKALIDNKILIDL